MLWFTSNPQALIAAVSRSGRMVGDETGIWFAVAVLFVAIAVVGGGLLAFLIRMAKDSSRAGPQSWADPDGLAGPDGKHLSDP